jgi:hypothetical protein
VIKKEAEKILKYKDITIEIDHMWDLKTNVMSVIIGQLELSQTHSENTRATYQGNEKSSEY